MLTARDFCMAGAIALGLFSVGSARAEKPVLTVYTYSSFSGEYGPGSKIEAGFEAQCGCDLTFVGLDDTGALLARLKLEGETTKADVALGLDSSQITEAAPLMQPHEQPMTALTMPGGWADPLFAPFDWGHIALIYDSEKLPAPPASLRALVEDANGPKLIVQDPRTSAPGFGFLTWMREVFGDETPAAWKKLRPRIVTFTKGWSEAYELFLKGEADMVVSYTTSPAYHIAVENRTNFKAAIFPEGHVLQIETMGVTKAARDPALAKRFIAYMLAAETQALLPEGNYMLPAQLPAEDLPASFKQLSLPERVIAPPPAEVAAQRRAMIDEWLAAVQP